FFLIKLLGKVVWEKVKIGLADKIIRRRHAENQLDIGVVADEPAALHVLDVNIVRQIVDERAQQITFFGEGKLGKFALGDIAVDAHEAGDFAVLIAQRHFGDKKPFFVACLIREQRLAIDDRFARSYDTLFFVISALRIFLWKKLEVGFAKHLVG